MEQVTQLSDQNAREIVGLLPDPLQNRQPGQWVSAPELVCLLNLSQWAGQICSLLRVRSLMPQSSQGSSPIYSDASIFMTALVMRIWRLSLGQITRWLPQYPALSLALGYPPARTISKSHLSRRLRALGPIPFMVYMIWLVRTLIEKGIIQGKDLVIDSTTVLAWYKQDLDAAYSFAKKFGYKVHTILCRDAMLPLYFIVSSANRNDSPFAVPLLERVVALYRLSVEVVRADAAYFVKELLDLIERLGARTAVDYNVRRKNKSLVLRTWMLFWDKRMGKRSAIERFFGIAKRWFGLNDFHAKGHRAFLMHTLLTYCAILSVALLAVEIGQPDLRLSPRRLLAPC